MEPEYQQYGDEWNAEMKKWSKQMLIDKLRDALIERSELRLQCELQNDRLHDLKDRYNDLLFDNCD